ncbi:MAG: hypothetical protein WA089_03860 [Anaerolineae bacterium]
MSAVTVGQPVQTLQYLRTLQNLYEQGYQDEVIDLTVRKLLERQIQRDEAQLHELEAELANYEQQFGMSSPEFAVRYQSGEAGDSLDVFEWNVIYKMHVRLASALRLMKIGMRSPG